MLGLYLGHYTHLTFLWVLGIWTQDLVLEQQALCLQSHLSSPKVLTFLLPPAPLSYWARVGDPTLIVRLQVALSDVYWLSISSMKQKQSEQKVGGKDNERPHTTYSSYTYSDLKCKPRFTWSLLCPHQCPSSLGHVEALPIMQLATSWLYTPFLLLSLFQSEGQLLLRLLKRMHGYQVHKCFMSTIFLMTLVLFQQFPSLWLRKTKPLNKHQ